MRPNFSAVDRALLVELYFKYNSTRKASEAFSALKPDLPKPAFGTVASLVAKFRQTGSVHDRKKVGRKSATGPANAAGVIVAKSLNPSASSREIASYAGISCTSVNRILKEHKCHPYKTEVLRTLMDNDFWNRAAFAEQVMEMVNQDETLLSRMCFTDELTFFLNGRMAHHNIWYWASHNPSRLDLISDNSPQLNVFAGIYSNQVIGPFFSESTSDESYLSMLQNEVGPAVTDAAEDDEIWWLQDGTPSRLTPKVQEYLNDTFPDRWVGNGGAISWPERSPDLTPMSYFLWGYIKHRVFQSRPADIEDLRKRIISACQGISLPLFEKSRIAFYNRLAYCAANRGGHFEHML